MINLKINLTKKNPTSLAILKERVEQNYADFKSEMLTLDEESIYGMAGRIAAVEDTYHQLTTYDYLNEDEAEYLLKFYNPLEMTADFLQEIESGQLVEVDEALFELFEREDNEENYVTAELAEELRRKHGADVSIKLALLRDELNPVKRTVKKPPIVGYRSITRSDDVFQTESDRFSIETVRNYRIEYIRR